MPAPQKALNAWGGAVTSLGVPSMAWNVWVVLSLRQALLEVGKHCPIKCQLRSMMKLIEDPASNLLAQGPTVAVEKTCAVEGLSCTYLIISPIPSNLKNPNACLQHVLYSHISYIYIQISISIDQLYQHIYCTVDLCMHRPTHCINQMRVLGFEDTVTP